jgi:ketosteroid isomerase-like protein
MRFQVIIMLICLLFTFISAETPETTKHPEYDTVKQVIKDSIGWAMTKDLDRLFQIFANDDQLLIWWVSSSKGPGGIAKLKKNAEQIWMTPDFKATRFEYRDIKIHFSKSGNVAWFSCHFDDCAIWKGKENCMLNIRKTGVLEKRKGQWVIVQVHSSWPINEIPDNIWEIISKSRNSQKKNSHKQSP